MFDFKVIDFDKINESEFYSVEEKSVYTTIEWLRFIKKNQQVEPVVIRIFDEDEPIGFFCGGLQTKFGVRIIGSPFRGWGTGYMGIELLSGEEENYDRLSIYRELKTFLFKEYKCSFIEVVDRKLPYTGIKEKGIVSRPVNTLELDISIDKEQLFKNFKMDCRNFIRQFERKGATIHEAVPNEAFADEFYNQLIDVFAKQGLVPTYQKSKVYDLISSLSEEDRVLCLKVLDPDGKCIASSIFPGYGDTFFFWGGASYRAYQYYRPNEYMVWYAIQYWKEKGCKVFDLMGVRDYKRKFNPEDIEYTRLIIAKNSFVICIRDMAEKTYYKLTKVKGFMKRKK